MKHDELCRCEKCERRIASEYVEGLEIEIESIKDTPAWYALTVAEDRIEQLKKQIRVASEINRNLANTNDEMSKQIEGLEKRIKKQAFIIKEMPSLPITQECMRLEKQIEVLKSALESIENATDSHAVMRNDEINKICNGALGENQMKNNKEVPFLFTALAIGMIVMAPFMAIGAAWAKLKQMRGGE